MEIRKIISVFFTLSCTSFTVIILFYCILWREDGITPQTVFKLFAVCAAVGVVVTVTTLFRIQSDVAKMGIYFA